MKPIILLALIPVIGINVGIYTESYFAALMSFVLLLTLTLPYVGKRLKAYADSHSEYRHTNVVTGFITARIR